MGSLSNFAELELLDHGFMRGSYSSPPLYAALSTADPTDDASGMAEPGGGSYARVSTAAGDWNAAASRETTNANAITFPQATGSWGTITHWALYDAATNGNMLVHGALAAPQAITTNDTFQIAAGDMSISFDAGGVSDDHSGVLLDHLFDKATYTMPSNLYVSLSTADPTDDASGDAPPGGYDYARVSTASGDWEDAASGATQNANAVTFPAANGGDWGTITHFAIWDAATVGNLLYYAALDASKAVNDGNTAKFLAGALDVTLT